MLSTTKQRYHIHLRSCIRSDLSFLCFDNTKYLQAAAALCTQKTAASLYSNLQQECQVHIQHEVRHRRWLRIGSLSYKQIGKKVIRANFRQHIILKSCGCVLAIPLVSNYCHILVPIVIACSRQIDLIRAIFLVLDRTYVIQNSTIRSIWYEKLSCVVESILF